MVQQTLHTHDIHVSMHHSIIVNDDQQDATI